MPQRDTETLVFHPTSHHRLIWGWGGLALSVACIALVMGPIGVVMYIGEADMALVVAITLAALFITSYKFLNYITRGYRAEISNGVIKVISPRHWSQEIEIDRILSVGGKTPRHHRVLLRTQDGFFDIPNYQDEHGASLHEVLREACGPEDAYLGDPVASKKVLRPDSAPVFPKRLAADISLLVVILGFLSWITIAGSLIGALAVSPIFMALLWKYAQRLDFSVGEDALFVTNGRKVERYDAADIMHVDQVYHEKSRTTRVHLASGQILPFSGNHVDEIKPLLDAARPTRRRGRGFSIKRPDRHS
jgi:hypothetical protein